MGVNKVIYFGETVVDMMDATATPETVLSGYTAYGADGDMIVGTAFSTKREQVSITLPKSGWVDGQQTISVPGVTEDASIVVGGDLGSEPEYSDCGIYCSAQADGALTFTAAWLPDADMTANVLIFT